MDESKLELSRNKYKLPYHWMRDSLHKDSLSYFGYAQIALGHLPPPPAQVLDAGCGDGRIAAEMVNRGYAVTGVDYLEIPILYAKIMVPEGTFFTADLRRDLVKTYRLRNGQFDSVVIMEVYEHIPPEDCEIVLTNVRSVLRPGGTLVISVPSRRLPPSKLHYRHFDRTGLEQELEAAGFHIQKMICQHRIDGLTSWLVSDEVERFMNNRWLQPVFLKRLRHRLYMRYANIVNDERRCGRFIAVAER